MTLVTTQASKVFCFKMTEFVKMTPYSRCGKYSSKLIKCPECLNISRVYNLSWAALSCQKCKKSHLKINWFIEKTR